MAGQVSRKQAMTKVLVLYDATYGHVATMAQAVAEGAGAAGAAIDTWSTGTRRRRVS